MKLEEMEDVCRLSELYSTGAEGRRAWIPVRDLARMIKALKTIKAELSADGDFEEMWPLSAAEFAELEQP